MMVELFQHQKDAIQATKGLNRVAYYLDMGLGKTFVGSEKMNDLGAVVNLVVCQKSKVDDWYNHFVKYYSDQGYIFNDLTNKKEFEYFIDVASQGQAKMVGIINYELSWRRKELLKLTYFTLMLDESSLIQNRKAKQSRFVLQLKPNNVILLSGTPCSGKYENLWTQIHLLGWNISEDLYNKQYVNWTTVDNDGYIHKIVDKKRPYKNIDRLKRKMRSYGAIFMKTEECYQLPEKNVVDLKIKSTADYKKFMKSCIYFKAGVELIGDTLLTKRLYARMIASQYNPNKIQAFADLIESTRDRVVVFYNFDAELELMREIISRPISIVNGKTKDLSAYETEDDSVTLVQYQAGAKGLNLQKANKIIYFSPTEKCEDWMQSQKRIHRIGQERPCYYYRMIAKGTIEERIYEALERGVDFTDELFKEMEK